MKEPVPKRPPGRPRVNATAVNVRLHPDLLAVLDEWRLSLPNPPNRPEAVRLRLIKGFNKQGKMK